MKITMLGRLARGSRNLFCGALLLALVYAPRCYSADLVFIQAPGGSSTEQRQLEIAAKFYGLNLRLVTARSATDPALIGAMVERRETVGVAIAASALPMVDQNSLLEALRTKRGTSESLLIIGIRPDVNSRVLRSWSGNTVYGCGRLPDSDHLQYSFAHLDAVTRQLAGVEIPLSVKDPFYLLLAKDNSAQIVADIRGAQQVFPAFTKTTVRHVNIFLSCATPLGTQPPGDGEIVDAFLRVAPEMLFVRYCSGQYGWHSLYHYANLTIDDPWLRQPYGYLNYRGLLTEMERHNFHTTIAFIPWNYERSDPAVVSLFRKHPQRFSIAIHGDNHDHKEFTDYRAAPLALQIAELKQSLARMQAFQDLTGIHYDKVMVFPHTIAPEKTLAALKTYNFLATVNSQNVPQLAVQPHSLSFDLRPVTLSFAGFPSLIRYSAAAPIPTRFIAVNEFLGNPILFYCHADFFAKGIDAFNGMADRVNKLEPDTRWRSLGEIVKHLYVVKQRDDSNYDVLAFSSDVCVDNTTKRDALFYVRKPEFGGQSIASVTSNGAPYEYHMADHYLTFIVPVAAGKSRCVLIQYENDLHLASVDISHRSVMVYLLRMGSDFRDIYLSRVPGGLAFASFYDSHKLTPPEALGFLFAVLALCIFTGYRLRIFVASRRSASRAGTNNPSRESLNQRRSDSK